MNVDGDAGTREEMKNAVPAIGDVFTIPHPFVRDVWTEHEQDEDGWSAVDVPTWRPGTRADEYRNPRAHSDVEPLIVNVADAMGSQELTVVGVYRPGSFPTRVFYTRQWRDPEGKAFGKRKCRVTTVAAFRAIVAGYRVPFELVASASLSTPGGR